MYRRILNSILLVSLLGIGCEQTTPSDVLIVGGVLTDPDALISRSTVSVRNKLKKSECTGTYIGNHRIVTAAHCGEKSNISMYVIFGLGFKDVKILKGTFHRHSEYRQTKNKNQENRMVHDIAYVDLDPGQEIPSYAVAAEIASTKPIKGTKVGIAGYGKTGKELELLKLEKEIAFHREHNVYLADDLEARKDQLMFELDEEGVIHGQQLRTAETTIGKYNDKDNVIITKSERSSSCFGDSGGPLYFIEKEKLYLVGVTSSANHKSVRSMRNCETSAVYTNAVAYRDKLLDHL